MHRLSHLRAVAFVLAAVLASWLAADAQAQTAVLQVGSWQPGHLIVYSGYQGGQAFVNDAGPASGSDAGAAITEFNISATGTGNPPYVGQGSGPDGTIGCFYDGPVGNAYGWHYLCLSANTALGGGEIDYGAAGGASTLPFYFKINGVSYVFPFSIGGIVGPAVTTAGHLAVWNNLTGSLLADGGPAPSYSVCGANNFATGFNASGVQQCAQPAFSNISGVATAAQGGLGSASLTGYLYGNGGATATASTTIPTSALTGVLQAAQSPAYIGDVSSPAGSLTMTLATVNSNVGTFGSATAIPVVTVNGKGLVTGVYNQPIGNSAPPNGRLTLTSATPVLNAATTGAGLIYFTPYLGANMPEWSATLSGWVGQPFSQISESLSDTTYAPAAAVANSIYDQFTCVIGGNLILSRGPAWSNTTTRSLALTQVGGLWVNAATYTNGCPSQQGVWVGTIATDPAAATVSFNPQPAAASGGPSGGAWIGLWNEFNRVPVAAATQDNKASWTYSSNTPHSVDASTNNRITQIVGQSQDAVMVNVGATNQTGAGAGGSTGVGVNSTTAFSGVAWQQVNGAGTANIFGSYYGTAALGQNYYQALEASNAGSTTTFLGAGGTGAIGPSQQLSAWMMF